ncbi:2Fe-2S iron-sulfur cluster-binding protein [Leifsonia sp. Le1]|uniref:2Fe-2S iron-sulfur cluster-binding protein n=1 Tax=Leifsonia sp. Le1 TaxID=3404918 RepID=UPI003EBCE0C4
MSLTVVFEHAGGGEPIEYLPGQFLTLWIPGKAGLVPRNYSLSSSPHIDDDLHVTVQRVLGGRASTWIHDELSPGMYIDADGPTGVFTPGDLTLDLTLVASGSGIGPIVSILKSALAAGTGKVNLLYLSRMDDAPFAEDIEALALEYEHRLTSTVWNSHRRGRIPVEQLRAFLVGGAGRELYLCGSTSLMNACAELAVDSGYEQHQIHREDFLSGTDPISDSLPRVVKAKVQLFGETHTWAWNNEAVLLESMLEQGIAAPFSCRSGICSACQCRVVAGDVVMNRADGLDPEQIEQNIVLACQSHAMSEGVELDFDI